MREADHGYSHPPCSFYFFQNRARPSVAHHHRGLITNSATTGGSSSVRFQRKPEQRRKYPSIQERKEKKNKENGSLRTHTIVSQTLSAWTLHLSFLPSPRLGCYVCWIRLSSSPPLLLYTLHYSSYVVFLFFFYFFPCLPASGCTLCENFFSSFPHRPSFLPFFFALPSAPLFYIHQVHHHLLNDDESYSPLPIPIALRCLAY